MLRNLYDWKECTVEQAIYRINRGQTEDRYRIYFGRVLEKEEELIRDIASNNQMDSGAKNDDTIVGKSNRIKSKRDIPSKKNSDTGAKAATVDEKPNCKRDVPSSKNSDTQIKTDDSIFGKSNRIESKRDIPFKKKSDTGAKTTATVDEKSNRRQSIKISHQIRKVKVELRVYRQVLL